MLKLYFTEAYEMLHWSILVDVLQARQFGPKWQHWIKDCLTGGKSKILVNGAPGRTIMSGRGLRR